MRHKNRGDRLRWMPKIVPDRPRKFNVGDGFDGAREVFVAECERLEADAVKPKMQENAERLRIVIAELQAECDSRFTWRFIEIACTACLIFGAVAGFIACLMWH